MTQATQSPSTDNLFPLPQELVDFIVDQIAYMSGDEVQDQSDLCGLITCTMISRAFSTRARAHLHGNIRLKVDKYTVRKRVSKLLESLETKPDSVSIPAIQSLAIIIQDHEPYSIYNRPTVNRRLQRESSTELSRLVQHSLTKCPPAFHHFSLVSRCFDQGDARNPTLPDLSFFNQALLEVFANSNLKTLQLVNIADVLVTNLADVFYLPHLVELTLNSLTFASESVRGSGISSIAPEGVKARTLAPSLKRLEMRHIPHKELLSYLLQISSGPDDSPSSPGLLFPKLQHLTISLNFDENQNPVLDALSEIGAFIEHNRSTLAELEIENFGYPGQGRHFSSSMRSRIPLVKLSSLRTLRFTICNDSSLDFLKKVLGELNLRPRGLKSRPCFCESFRSTDFFQSLDLKVVLPAPKSFKNVKAATIAICKEITGSHRLPHIDNILSTATTANIGNINILLVLFHHNSSTAEGPDPSIVASIEECWPDITRSWISAFPKTMSSGRVGINVEVRHVFSHDTMERYLRYACCTKWLQ